MGRERNNSHHDRQPEDEDRYVENLYMHDEDYEERHARPQRTNYRSHPDTRRRRYPDAESDYRRTAPRRVVRQIQPTPKRRIWPILLAGCGIGFLLAIAALAIAALLGINAIQNGGHITGLPGIPSNHAFTQTKTQAVTLTQLSNVLICDKIGNVTMTVDPNATKTTITALKTVQATNASAANTLLQKISVEIQPPTTSAQALNCTTLQTAITPTATNSPTTTTNSLIINVSLPQVTDNQVDLTITVPPIAIQSDQPSLALDIEAARGNIDVEGISGKLLLQGSIGNITVKQAILTNGSQLQTSAGDITFSGFLLVPTDTNAQSNVSYMLSNETGNINVSVPANPNVMLDTYTNVGTITSTFPIKVNNAGGTISYDGPLNPSNGSPLSATLILHSSSGNVHIQKSN